MGRVKTTSLEVRGTLDYILITLALYLCGNIKKSMPFVATQLPGLIFVLCNFESPKYVLRIEQASTFQCGLILPS